MCAGVPQVSKAIWKVLKPVYMPEPDTNMWLKIASHFESKLNFPYCIGALDGKHVVIKAPSKSGSQYYNYKKLFSTVLLAVVDADYCFVVVDIGAYEKNSHGGVLQDSLFGKYLRTNLLGIPTADKISGSPNRGKMPYVLIGDEAFPLSTNLMRPFPFIGLTHEMIIFNYRLSRAGRIVENAFGILAARWQVYRRLLSLHPCNADTVVQATVVLHNFLRLGTN